MAVQLINIGQVANDGTGDDLREAFIKINQNFEELDLRDDEQTTASNIGAIGEGVFAKKLNYDLQFKKLVPGTDVTLSATDDQITINAAGGLKSLLVVSDNGSIILQETAGLNIQGGNGIETSISDDTLTIEYTGLTDVVNDATPQLGGNLDAQGFAINNIGNIDANNFTGSFTGNLAGNVTGLVHGIDIRDIDRYFQNFDLGNIRTNYQSAIEYLIANVDIELGDFDNPNPNVFDFGLL